MNWQANTAIGIVAAFGFLTASDSLTIVQPRQRAVAVTLGHKGPVMHEGVHWVKPWVANVNKFDLTLNVSENAGVQLKTKDSQTIHLDVIGHYCLTAGCLDPEKAENVPDTEIDKQYYTFKDTDYHSVYKSFLLEAASDAVGKRAITAISSEISAIAEEIKLAVIKKLTDAGYTSLHTQDVLLRNFTMEPAAEAFANNVANDMQRATQLQIQGINLDQEQLNATKKGEVLGNELRAAATGIAGAVTEIVTKAGISKDAATQLVTAQLLIGKWNGTSQTAPLAFPGASPATSVLVGGDPSRTERVPALPPPGFSK